MIGFRTYIIIIKKITLSDSFVLKNGLTSHSAKRSSSFPFVHYDVVVHYVRICERWRWLVGRCALVIYQAPHRRRSVVVSNISRFYSTFLSTHTTPSAIRRVTEFSLFPVRPRLYRITARTVFGLSLSPI